MGYLLKGVRTSMQTTLGKSRILDTDREMLRDTMQPFTHYPICPAGFLYRLADVIIDEYGPGQSFMVYPFTDSGVKVYVTSDSTMLLSVIDVYSFTSWASDTKVWSYSAVTLENMLEITCELRKISVLGPTFMLTIIHRRINGKYNDIQVKVII